MCVSVRVRVCQIERERETLRIMGTLAQYITKVHSNYLKSGSLEFHTPTNALLYTGCPTS